jgi:glycerol-3-phosphate dehydrogenase
MASALRYIVSALMDAAIIATAVAVKRRRVRVREASMDNPRLYWVSGTTTVTGGRVKPFRVMAGTTPEEVWSTLGFCHRDGVTDLIVELPDGTRLTEFEFLQRQKAERKAER